MPKLTKDALIKMTAQDTGMTQKKCRAVIDSALGVIALLPVGGAIHITGLGTFKAEMTKARALRNPATGETMQAQPRRRLTFKESKPSK